MIRLMRLPEVMKLVGLSRTTVYELIKRSQFPKPVKPSQRVSAWCSDEVEQWVESRRKASALEPEAA